MSVEFNYPKHGNYSLENNERWINAYDDIWVQWWSSWPGVNLTLACLTAAGSNKSTNYDAPGNPLPPIGQYDLGPAIAKDNWEKYPTACELRLTRPDDTGSDAYKGQNFVISSSSAKAVTFSPTASVVSGSSSTSSSTVLSIVGASPTISVAVNSSTPSSETSSLTTGAKAGIGVGSGAVVVIVAGLLIGIVWKKSRSKRNVEKLSAPAWPEEEKVDTIHVLPKAEVDGVGLHEMGSTHDNSHEAGDGVVHELHSGDGRYELPSSK